MTLLARLTEVLQQIGTDVRAILPRLLPAGGTASQVLTKVDASDYNAVWTDPGGIRSTTFEWALDLTDPTYITLNGPLTTFPELSLSGANVFASGSGLYQLAPSGADPTLSGYFDLPPGESIANISDARVYTQDGRFWSPAASLTADPGTPGRVLYTGAIGFVAKTLPKPWPPFTLIPVDSEIGVAGNGNVVLLYGINPFKISVFKVDSSTYTTDFTATALSDPVTFRVYKF